MMIRFLFGTVTRTVIVFGGRMKASQGLVIFGEVSVIVQKEDFR